MEGLREGGQSRTASRVHVEDWTFEAEEARDSCHERLEVAIRHLVWVVELRVAFDVARTVEVSGFRTSKASRVDS